MIIILGARSGTSVLFRSLERTGFHADSSWYRRRSNDSEHRQFRAVNIRLRKAEDQPGVIVEAKELWSDILDRGVELIKEPHFSWVWHTWLKALPEFVNYQYIWMRRSLEDRAYSLYKYQTIRGYKDRSMDKCYEYCKAMDSAIFGLVSRTPNYLPVAFDEFVNLKGIGAISKFVGRELDISLIDATKVSAYSGERKHAGSRPY
jgi:hypothetical protein